MKYKPIPKHREYIIDVQGNVKRITTGKLIQPSNKGYVTLLTKDALDINGDVYDRPYFYRLNVKRLLHQVHGIEMKECKGENHPKFKGWYIVNGGRYPSSYEASRATGINARTIYRKCMRGDDGFKFESK